MKRKKEKDKGEIVSDVFAIILTIMSCFLLLFAGIYFLKFTETKNNISVAMRGAILQMEETGYLDDLTKAQLSSRLQNIGIVGPDGNSPQITGTTEDSAERPQLTLTVKGKFSMKKLSEQALSGKDSGSWIDRVDIPVDMTQTSVAVGIEPES